MWEMTPVIVTGWEWPEWVPAPLRITIEVHWTPNGGRKAWEADAARRGVPQLGELVDGGHPARHRPPDDRHGRYVHLWGDVGRLVMPGGHLIATVWLHHRLGTFSLAGG